MAPINPSKFKLGDPIKIVGLSLDVGKLGVVVEVNAQRASYKVRLANNTTKDFFESSLSVR